MPSSAYSQHPPYNPRAAELLKFRGAEKRRGNCRARSRGRRARRASNCPDLYSWNARLNEPGRLRNDDTISTSSSSKHWLPVHTARTSAHCLPDNCPSLGRIFHSPFPGASAPLCTLHIVCIEPIQWYCCGSCLFRSHRCGCVLFSSPSIRADGNPFD